MAGLRRLAHREGPPPLRLGLEVLPPLPPGHLARASRPSLPGFPTPDVGLPRASRSRRGRLGASLSLSPNPPPRPAGARPDGLARLRESCSFAHSAPLRARNWRLREGPSGLPGPPPTPPPPAPPAPHSPGRGGTGTPPPCLAPPPPRPKAPGRPCSAWGDSPVPPHPGQTLIGPSNACPFPGNGESSCSSCPPQPPPPPPPRALGGSSKASQARRWMTGPRPPGGLTPGAGALAPFGGRGLRPPSPASARQACPGPISEEARAQLPKPACGCSFTSGGTPPRPPRPRGQGKPGPLAASVWKLKPKPSLIGAL